MEAMQLQIERIEDKVQQLLKEYNIAQKEIQRLQKENQRLTDQLHVQIELAQQMQQKADTLRLQSHGMSNESNKDLEKRINMYLKDIDKCLALLNA